MITLSIPTPPPTPIQRVKVIRIAPPLFPAEQYCGIVRAQEGESFVCAVIHPYRTAHMYASAFPALLPLLREDVWPARQMSEVTWADIAYTNPDSSRPQLLVRTTRIESATAEIRWQDRDHTYARTWESRVQPVIDLLNLIRA
jgi:hypothetical protein